MSAPITAAAAACDLRPLTPPTDPDPPAAAPFAAVFFAAGGDFFAEDGLGAVVAFVRAAGVFFAPDAPALPAPVPAPAAFLLEDGVAPEPAAAKVA